MAGTMQFLQRWNTIAEEIIKNKKNSLEWIYFYNKAQNLYE
jgi:hypothetical protein